MDNGLVSHINCMEVGCHNPIDDKDLNGLINHEEFSKLQRFRKLNEINNDVNVRCKFYYYFIFY